MWLQLSVSLSLSPATVSVSVDSVLCLSVCFVLTYATADLSGPMVWAPLSEVPQIGRMPIYIITLAIFVVLQVPTALATNYGMLMAFRFLTGFFGSPILATGGATIADLYVPKKRAYGMTIWGVFAASAPSPRSASRKFLCAFRELALDDMGADVALCGDSGPALLLLPRDLRVQHPIPPCAPSPQGHRKSVDHVRS
jgi:MFS family permease